MAFRGLEPSTSDASLRSRVVSRAHREVLTCLGGGVLHCAQKWAERRGRSNPRNLVSVREGVENTASRARGTGTVRGLPIEVGSQTRRRGT
jgi:hypothetical protein